MRRTGKARANRRRVVAKEYREQHTSDEFKEIAEQLRSDKFEQLVKDQPLYREER